MAKPDISCSTCVWWHQHGAPIAAALRKIGPHDDIGTCQVRPPQLAPSPHFPVGTFPETRADRFCSEWMDDWTTGDGGEEEKVTPITGAAHLRSVA